MKELSKIQSTLNCPKNRHNNHGNYSYRTCEDILESLKPLLGEAIITLSDDVVFLSDKSIHKQKTSKGETVLESDRVYVKATATFTIGSSSVSCSGMARESLWKPGTDASQITGTASSYARKSALSGLLMLDDSQDADTKKNYEEAVKNSTPANLITDTQLENISVLFEKAEMGEESKITAIKWASETRTHLAQELSQAEAAKLISATTQKIERNAQ